MKKFLITAFTSLSFILPTAAVTVDTDSLGTALNGWHKNNTASYSIASHPYRTHKPTISPNTVGGIFISTRVDYRPRFGKKMSAYIELNYTAGGTLLSSQIKVMAGDLRLNTGAISRPALAAAPAQGKPAAEAEPWLNPTTKMVNELFTALDAEFAKLSKRDQNEKKDVFSRVFGKGYQTADLSSALRHNLNLLLAHTK